MRLNEWELKLKGEAESGDAHSQYLLAAQFHRRKNWRDCMYWLQKSVEQGYADGIHLLGEKYLDGLGLPQDIEEAIRLFELAGEKGHNRSFLQLADVFANDVYHVCNEEKSDSFLEKASSGDGQASKIAKFRIAKSLIAKTYLVSYWRGQLMTEGRRQQIIGDTKTTDSINNAVRLLKDIISDGDDWWNGTSDFLPETASGMLAKIYLDGIGEHDDLSMGLEYLEAGVELLDSESQYRKASYLFNGTYMDKDAYMATCMWHELAYSIESGGSNSDYPESYYQAAAAYAYGKCNQLGLEINPDITEALNAFDWAAEFGDPWSIFETGLMLTSFDENSEEYSGDTSYCGYSDNEAKLQAYYFLNLAAAFLDEAKPLRDRIAGQLEKNELKTAQTNCRKDFSENSVKYNEAWETLSVLRKAFPLEFRANT